MRGPIPIEGEDVGVVIASSPNTPKPRLHYLKQVGL